MPSAIQRVLLAVLHLNPYARESLAIFFLQLRYVEELNQGQQPVLLCSFPLHSKTPDLGICRLSLQTKSFPLFAAAG